MKQKQRLDHALKSRGLVESRQRGQALILAGRVLVNREPVDKPGHGVTAQDDIAIKGEDIPYVSRGGLKLAGALEVFGLGVKESVCLDVGASTGGFTDCLLQNGASLVYAVDVGYGQLAWKLRQDPRVISIERTNIRHMPADRIDRPVDIITIDVSFISLRIVIPAVLPFLKQQGHVLALIKPQFEVGRENVGKGGVVRDPGLHEKVTGEIADFCCSLDLNVIGKAPSPITGPKGNREFFILLQSN